MQPIQSKDNQYLKLARALSGHKARQEQGCFLAEGVRLVEEAARAGDCRYALFAEARLEQPRVAQLAEALAEKGVSCFCLPEQLLEKAAATEHSQGVLAVVNTPAQVRPAAARGYYAYCDGVSDPGNLGTIMRSGYAAGLQVLLLSGDCADPYNPKTVRASMGAIFRLPVYRCRDEEDAWQLMQELQASPLVTAMDGQDIRRCGALLAKNHVWILGAEAEGVRPFWRQRAAAGVSLPMREGAESLNVASAAAVLFYQSFFAMQA